MRLALVAVQLDDAGGEGMSDTQVRDEVVTLSFPPESSLVIGAGPAPEIDVVAGE